MTMTESERLREALIQALARAGQIRSLNVSEAFAAVPRELFVPEIAKNRGLAYVYEDRALVTQEHHGVATSSSSQPAIMALMLEALSVQAGNRVLEVGLGTGYNAALLSRLAGPGGSVTSIDIDEGILERAKKVLQGNGFRVKAAVADGREGCPGGGPFDRIIVTASSGQVPRAWWDQLAPDGILVMPLRLGALQTVAVFERTSDGFRSRELIPGGFMPLRDPAAAGAPPAEESTATVTVKTSLPGQPAQSLSVSGPALANMSPQLVRRLVGHLVADPSRREVAAADGLPVLWHTALTCDPRRQITVYLDGGGIRFGLADLQAGAFSTFAVERADGHWALAGIDSFGPDQAGVDDLLGHLQSWADSGSPSMDQLTVEVCYSGAARNSALHTVEGEGHFLSFAWA